MLTMHLYARVQREIYAYSSISRSWSRVDPLARISWPDGADFCLLADGADEVPHWSGSTEGVVHYVDRNWLSFSLILELRGLNGASLHIPVSFPLCQESRQFLQVRHTEWFQHLHSTYRGELRQAEGGASLCFVVAEMVGTDYERVRYTVLNAVVYAFEETPEARWARRLVLPLVNVFGAAVAVDLLQPDSIPAALGPSRTRGMEPLLHHIVHCAACREGHQCASAPVLLQSTEGTGRPYQQLCHIIRNPLRSAERSVQGQSSQLEGSLTIYARFPDGVVAGTLPTPQWAAVPKEAIPPSWPVGSTFAMQAEGESDSVVVDDGQPVLTYLSTQTGRVGLLLSFRSSATVYHAPLNLQLDDDSVREALGNNPDSWREWSQRVVSGAMSTAASPDRVRFRLEARGLPATDRLRSALVEALLDERPRTPLQEKCRALTAECAQWYGVGIALETLGLGGDYRTLRYEVANVDLRPFLRHLLRCETSRAGDPCAICHQMVAGIEARPNSGLRMLRRALEARIERTKLLADIATLVSPASGVGDREVALTRLRSTGVESLIDALPTVGLQWPVTMAWRLGAPWSLLAWISTTRPQEATNAKNGTAPAKRVRDGDVIQHGWNVRRADQITGLLVNTLREERSTTPQLILGGLAFAEMASRHKQALHPLSVARVLRAFERVESAPAQRILAAAGNRLAMMVIEAGFGRRDSYSEADAQELWSCLSAMPAGKIGTRLQWLRVFYLFPQMRPIIEPAVAQLDPDCPIIDAFRWPVPRPPGRLLDSLAAAPASEIDMVDSARLHLVWHWYWMDSSGSIDETPPVPSMDETRVDGNNEYLRQFLWGCWRVAAPEAEPMWRTLLSRLLDRPSEQWVENQAWMSAGRYRARVGRFDSEWASMARRRLSEVLASAKTLDRDLRAVSLLRLLGVVEEDTTQFAQAWLRVEPAYDGAGVQAERQRCFAFLAARSDLAPLASDPEVRARLNSALLTDNTFVQAAALRCLFGAANIREAVEWLCRPSVHKLLWASEGAFWLQRIAAADLPALREWVLALLERIALRQVAPLARVEDVQFELEAIRSLDLLDPPRSARMVERLIRRRNLDVVRFWLRDRPLHHDGAARLQDGYWQAAVEAGGADLGRAAELALQLEARGVLIRPENWSALAGAIQRSVTSAVTTSDVAWLLAGMACVPAEYREPLGAFETEARLILFTPGAPGQMTHCVASFLSALGTDDGWAAPDGVEGGASLSDYVRDHVRLVLDSEPSPVVLRLLTCLWTSEWIQKETRSALVLSLAGSRNQRPPAALLALLTRETEAVLETGPASAEFGVSITRARNALKNCEHVIDAAGLDLARALDIHWDDLLVGGAGERLGVPTLLAKLPGAWERPDGVAFTRLFRIVRLLGLRLAVTQYDALLHDVAKIRNADEVARLREQVGAEFVRIVLPTKQRFEQPWLDVHRAVVDLVERSGWSEVEVVAAWATEEIAARREDALRLGAGFDLGDLTTAVHNLVSNAIQHGGGPVQVVVGATEIAIRNLQRAPVPPEFWSDLNSWLNHPRVDAPEPASVRPRAGLRSVRRALRRNTALYIRGITARSNSNPVGWEGGEDQIQFVPIDEVQDAGTVSVLTVSWQRRTVRSNTQ